MNEYESGYEFPRKLANKVRVLEPDGTEIVYHGCVHEMSFEGTGAMWGKAWLAKVRVRTRPQGIVRKFVWWRLSRRNVLVPRREKKVLLWQVDLDRSNFVIYDGKPVPVSHSFGIRDLLMSNAANQGIVLTERLLDEVFDPIEKEVLRHMAIFRDAAQGTKLRAVS